MPFISSNSPHVSKTKINSPTVPEVDSTSHLLDIKEAKKIQDDTLD